MGKVKIHSLFQYLLDGFDAAPEAFLGLSNAAPPRLGDFLDDLDPDLPLDWNGVSFQGLPNLRERVIAQAGLQGSCSPGDVLITAGAAEANYLIFRQVLSPGDHVVLERPGWPQAEVMARAIGCDIGWVDRDPRAGWDLPLNKLADEVSEKTRMVFLTNPNNPTGRLIPEDDLRDIAAVTERVGAWLVVDEVYAGLEWGLPRPPSIAGVAERGITTGSVSKALGLQGLRTGWMIARNEKMIRDALVLRENSSEIMNIMGEAIAEIALRPDRFAGAIARARDDATAGLAEIARFAATMPELDWQPPEAGLIGLAKLITGHKGDDVARAMRGPPYRTFLIPGEAYHQPHHLRLGVGGGAGAGLKEALARLRDCLRSMPSN